MEHKTYKRELLFSVTANDCKWDYFVGTGPGGQKRNKTASCVRCTHKASGAVGQACESRQQRTNREKAFERMAQTEEFKAWHKFEVARRVGLIDEIQRKVEKEMKKIKVEIKKDGKWTEVDKNDPLSDIEIES